MTNPQITLIMLYDSTIAIYILLDDMLQAVDHKAPPYGQVNDGLVMTTALLAAWYFAGNWESARSYMQSHHCPQMLSKSRFNRRLHALSQCCEQCFRLLGWVANQSQQHYVLDTFPVAVCHNIGIPRCRLLQGEDYGGKNASKREYFYGYKVALLINSQGLPVELALIPGSYSEQSALAGLDFDLPAGSVVWQDSGFTDYEWEDFYPNNEGIDFATQRKKNSLRGDDFPTYIAKKQNRKRVETAISEITARFPKRMKALTIEAFQFKLVLCVLAFAIVKYFNL